MPFGYKRQVKDSITGKRFMADTKDNDKPDSWRAKEGIHEQMSSHKKQPASDFQTFTEVSLA